ncbi:MAG: nucleotidyl transferase AbiEii/AbiGii toxin family protein [Sulfurimonas sp.]|nr:nucleotidyl transferase AbiEii/AbiGii toxin family protein [Sulfurimonas sp.]
MRVTFHTTTDIKLGKDDSINYRDGYINITNIDTIAAMKMYSVLRYRIKSRDFYDLYTLLNDRHFNFNQIIDLTQKNYPESSFESILVENRLLKSKLDADDEGLETLRLNENVDFKYIRKYFKTLILSKVKAESDALLSEIYSTLTDMRFGLDNSTLCIKLAQDGSYSKLDEYCSLGLNIYPNEKNLSKKNSFSFSLR